MLLRVGVLGSGNFGGQVASVAAAEGFPALALNASARDLELLQKDVIPFQIGDGKADIDFDPFIPLNGAGCDRLAA